LMMKSYLSTNLCALEGPIGLVSDENVQSSSLPIAYPLCAQTDHAY